MESFELGKEIEKKVFSSCHERGTKEKFWVSLRNRTSDLRIPRFDALPLNHRDSMVRKAHYEGMHYAGRVSYKNFVVGLAYCRVSVV